MCDRRTPEDLAADALAVGETDVRHLDRAQLEASAASLLAAGNRLALIACHEDATDFRIVYCFVDSEPPRCVELSVRVPRDDAWVPSLAEISLSAGNFERGIRDLYGVVPRHHPQPHRLVRHGHWPRGWYPMLRANTLVPEFEPDVESFPFVPVEGPGVYEIAVGPIHAGIIEPGHFRFSVVGETIVRMEARQWYLHRGVEKVFEGKTAAEGVLLAEQISGDTAVGHSLAFVMAVEQAAAITVKEPDRLLRALLLELERLYNHVTDLGSLANDAGFGIVDAQAQGLREELLRINKLVTGHRLLRGSISVGGTRVNALPEAAPLQGIAAAVAKLVDITLGHAIVRGRFTGTAQLNNARAVEFGTLGYVARASGVNSDARREHPFVDLGDAFRVVLEQGGDVLARYTVRAREVEVSTNIVIDLLGRLQGHTGSAISVAPGAFGTGLALVEAWRGTATHRVELASDGTLARVKIVDPSFFNWPAVPEALSETIVPDFPLANKSFNLSYAGNDL